MANVEELLVVTEAEAPKTEDNDIEVKRESLAILASLGTTKEYTGVSMSFADVHKLKPTDVEKYFVRYQNVMGQQVNQTLIESTLHITSRVISYILPIDDADALCKDLQNDELVKRELSSFAGFLALRGGRLLALTSSLVQVAKHVNIKLPPIIPERFGGDASTTEQDLENSLASS